MEKGKIIVIEGACDGIGKTTQYNLLKENLIKKGYNVITHHFPSYGTKQGEGVEKYLRGEYGAIKDLSPMFINDLYYHDRSVTWNTDLKAHYEVGDIILLDRYTTSSLIYQSTNIDDMEEKKKFIDEVIEKEYSDIKEPDMVIFLTAPYDIVAELRKDRVDNEGIKNDIHERDNEYMKKTHNNSVFISEYLGWNIVNCESDGKLKSIKEIHNDIVELVEKKLSKKNEKIKELK